MKRTSAGILLVAAVIGAAAGFVLDQLLTASGRPTFSPGAALPVFLVALGILVLVLAAPIRRATQGKSTTPVNPFRAVRVAVLAKSSSIVGAGLGGFAVGLAIFLVTRPVTPSLGSLSTVLATIVCGALLVVAGLVAEHLCTIRKDDDDEHPGGADPGIGAHDH